jgi:hypothetical protein
VKLTAPGLGEFFFRLRGGAGAEAGKELPGPAPPEASRKGEAPGVRQPPQTAASLDRLAQALALPQDTLSSALLSFVRYFSLPLEPALTARLRREALSQQGSSRESAALAAAAAEDKGVRLSAETLRRYAAAMDTAMDHGDRGTEAHTSGEEYGEGHEHEDTGPPFAEKMEKKPAGEIRSGDIRKKYEKIEANIPFLRLLNKIPGKNGRRWVVFPFTFSSKGVVFRVSVRILLNNDEFSGYSAERLGVDIAGKRRRWLFILDKVGKTGARAEVALAPPLPAGSSPDREIRKLLAPFVRDIVLKEGDLFPWGDCGDKDLPSVNEEV